MAFGTYDQGSSDRGLSTKLWLGCNPDVIRNDPRHGMFVLDDFTNVTALTADATENGWKFIETTAGRVVEVDDEDYGVIAIGGGDGTDNNGQAMYKSGATITPAAGTTIVVEARVKANTITAGLQAFIGLVDATDDTAIMASGATTPTDLVGFYTPDNTVLTFVGEQGGSAGTITAAHTLAEDTYVKVGFRINGTDDADVYVNGSKIDNNLVAADIPDSTLRLAIANYSEGTDASLLSVDWVAVGVF